MPKREVSRGKSRSSNSEEIGRLSRRTGPAALGVWRTQMALERGREKGHGPRGRTQTGGRGVLEMESGGSPGETARLTLQRTV